MANLQTRHLCSYRADLASPQQDVGAGHFGRRMIATVIGGEFHGERLSGVVLPGGGDWATIDENDTLRLDARVTFQTHDGAMIYVSYRGVLRPLSTARRHAVQGGPRNAEERAELYFRTAPMFETGDARYRWLTELVTIGVGSTTGNAVHYELFEVA
jgi:hypothetical protein